MFFAIIYPNALITSSAVMCFPASSFCSPPQITTPPHTHPQDRGAVRHHAWAATWKWLAFHSFSLNLPVLHLACFGNTVTSKISWWHDPAACPTPLPRANLGHVSQEEHPINKTFFCFFSTHCFSGFPSEAMHEAHYYNHAMHSQQGAMRGMRGRLNCTSQEGVRKQRRLVH